MVAGSAVLGPLAAGVATVGVFGGAPEHVLTGTGLLGLALGWAALALGSTTLTGRPQRWAAVPAAALGAVGTALLVLAPGDGPLTAAGWLWPPLLLGLAGWTIHRAVRSFGLRLPFWLLSPVLVLLVLASVGGAATTVRTALGGSPSMPGELVDVGDRRLHLACTGSGGPTVVLLGGMGETSAAWGLVQPAVAGTTRVCAYDRAGQAWSDSAPGPKDGVQVATDLHDLLNRAGERGPFVLAGHSVGGTYAMVYAAQYPDDVAGLVLLDSSTPHQFTALPDYPGAYSLARRATALLPTLQRLGAGPLLTSGAPADLPAAARAQMRAFDWSTRQLRAERDEVAAYPAVFEQAQALPGIGSTPLVVVTATAGDRQAGWSAAQDALAELSPTSSHRLVPATHSSLLLDASASAFSVAAVEDVVRAVRAQAAVLGS
ncbi:alpha/beta hydrolase [Blastococcus saxobsidens]|uniref:Alpha/beta hydrolase n=1 Tax=Blastococcus saxobsidens TaxID=138336 RepID=A0A6L9W633_9ACTN|nr:alpha/beta hydrolase [Blastococcus saxobsidens]